MQKFWLGKQVLKRAILNKENNLNSLQLNILNASLFYLRKYLKF